MSRRSRPQPREAERGRRRAGSTAGLIACNTGYARYVDNHIGVSLGGPDSLSLDANAESLCRNDVGFHNGNDSYDWGSNWCRGASGLGVEFQGNFDWTFFHPELVDPLDYCAKLGSGDSMDFCPYNMTAIEASSPTTLRSPALVAFAGVFTWDRAGLFLCSSLSLLTSSSFSSAPVTSISLRARHSERSCSWDRALIAPTLTCLHVASQGCSATGAALLVVEAEVAEAALAEAPSAETAEAPWSEVEGCRVAVGVGAGGVA